MTVQHSGWRFCPVARLAAPLCLALMLRALPAAAASADEATATGATEALFSGSFLGALLFGLPYQEVGKVDLLALALLLFFVFRAVMAGKGQKEQGDRFSAARRSELWNRQDESPNKRAESQNSVEHSRNPASGENGKNTTNAWSARLRGEECKQGPASRKKRTVQENAAAMWGSLSSYKQEKAQTAPPVAQDMEAGFDVNDFLEGARTLYVRLQQAWAARKVDELAPFISTPLLELLQKQAKADPKPVTVEILLVNGTLNGIVQEKDGEKAEVAFSVLMRTGQEEAPAEIREVWQFVRSSDSGGMWRLTGIRQA